MINAAIGNKVRFDQMKEFFGGAGAGHSAGVWEAATGVPQDRPEFKAEQRRLAAKAAKKRKDSSACVADSARTLSRENSVTIT